MKLDEILKDEAQVKKLLQTADWISDDQTVELAEAAIYELWKLDRVKAIELWEKNAKHAIPGVLPDFIARRAIQEGIEFQ